MTDGHVPVRTCIGCRQRATRDELVRYVLMDGPDGGARVERDDAGRLPGRGAWVHDSDACRNEAIRRRALRRALRSEPGDVSAFTP